MSKIIYWTEEEIEFLKNNYPEKGFQYCFEHLNFSEGRVRKKICGLKLKLNEKPFTGKKICIKCNFEKQLEEFRTDKKGKYGKGTVCLECSREYGRCYAKVKLKELKNDENFKNKRRIACRKSHHKHKEKYSLRKKAYYQKHKQYILAKNRENKIKRLKKNIGYRIKETLSSRIRAALKGNKNGKLTIKLLGCDIITFQKHLEHQFKPGMTWENYGYYGWHIDHILPCCMFDLTKEDEQLKCFHYSNLRPLWREENMLKGGKWNIDYQI